MADEEKTEETTEETPVAEPAAEAQPRRRLRSTSAPAEETPAEEPSPRRRSLQPRLRSLRPRRLLLPRSLRHLRSLHAPAPQSQPKQKHKRLPRPLRPKKGRRLRTPATERKPISREEKPEHDRGRRQERRGVVVSDAMDKTIVVKVDSIRQHKKYKKVIRRSVKFHAHDEENSAHIGDVVRIVETRPLSKTKRWRLAEIVEVAK